MRGQVLGRLSRQLAATVCIVILAGCASGGGSGGGTSGGGSSGGAGGGTSGGGTGGGTSGGGTGGGTTPTTVTTPAPATFGSNTKTPQIADPNGPNFNSTVGMPIAGLAFPLKQSAIKIYKNGWSLDTATNNGGATLTVSGTSLTNIALSVPSLGLSNQPVINTTAALANYVNNLSDGVLLAAPMGTYAMAGEWLAISGGQGTLSAFATGYQTPTSAMPHIGTGTANSTVTGFALKSADVAFLTGKSTLSIDFSSGAISGSLNNMTATDSANVASKWNDVTVKANISGGTSSFSGTTVAATSPGTGWTVNNTGSGSISGDFYGPAAETTAGVWSIGDGNVAAFGSLIGGVVKSGTTVPPVSSWAPLTIGAPDAAAYGPGAISSRLASATSPIFDGSSANYPTENFPALMTVLAQSGTSIQPTLVHPGTVTFSDTCTAHAGCHDTQFTLTIQALGFSKSLNLPMSLKDGRGTASNYDTDSLSYVAFGIWSTTPDQHTSQTSGGQTYTDYEPALAFGFQTPAANVPTTGAANYAGPVDGVVMVPTNGSGVTNSILSGNADVNVNFASGAVSGSFSDMKSTLMGSVTPWNSVAVSANIVTGSNTFSGGTSVTSAPSGSAALKSTAKGTIAGGFYGPNAQEIGAVWTLSDGTSAAIGTVGGRKQ